MELDRLTQDVARMTDDLAMDLDLDGPEKNVYVVNPSNPIIYNPPVSTLTVLPWLLYCVTMVTVTIYNV